MLAPSSLLLALVMTGLSADDPGIKKPTLPTISFDGKGNNTSEIPYLEINHSFAFAFPPGLELYYEPSDEIGDGQVFCEKAATYQSGTPIRIDPTVQKDQKQRPVRAIYFNLRTTASLPVEERRKLDLQLAELRSQKVYYDARSHPLAWNAKQALLDEIADKNALIAEKQEEIKAFTGTSIASAVAAIEARQKDIRDLRADIRIDQKKIDGSALQDQIATLETQISVLEAKLQNIKGKHVLVRAGVLVVGGDRKPVYYSLNKTADASAPWILKRFQKFPVFTTNDIPYVVVLGQRTDQDPTALKATFATKAGAYIDTDPVRPVLTQGSVPSGMLKISPASPLCIQGTGDNAAFIDRVLPFADHLAGETIYTVTVSGYGTATTTDSLTVVKGSTPSSQQQTVTAKTTLKPLDGEAWPQVHSLYRYNLSTGVIWSTLRTPTFARVATGQLLPPNCDPTVISSTTTCLPTYQTNRLAGGPRVIPEVMFTLYPMKRDTQVKSVAWKEVLPSPAIGVALTSPTDDFFLGASSELKPFRNIQIVYGLHLGRIARLSAADSNKLPTDSTAPLTTTTLQKAFFVGMNFNLDFVKGLFKP